MTCCDPCDCIATVRVRQLVNPAQTFDVLLDQQPSARQQDEFWYFGTDRLLRNYDCRWSGVAEIDADTRYEVRVWHSTKSEPLLTVAPLNDDGRPLCLHVFSSLTSPHNDYAAPPPHEWSVDVTDAGNETFTIAFRGQHLGYPVPLTLIAAAHDPADITRDEKLDLIQFAAPGVSQVYRLTRALDLNGNPLTLQLQTWSGSVFPLLISADATADDIRYAIAPNQSVTLSLPTGATTTASLTLSASPDAVSLSVVIEGPAISGADLPDGETITFSIWHDDDPSFASEVRLYDNVLQLIGFGGTGTPALPSDTPMPGGVKRYVRVKALSSAGADASVYQATVRLTGHQSLPPITANCERGAIDLFAFSETIGDATLGPQFAWKDLTVWLTLHEVATPPTRIRNEPADRSAVSWASDSPSLFDPRGRIYIWPIDPTPDVFDHLYRDLPVDYAHLQPPWYVASLQGGNDVFPDSSLAGVWIDKQLTPAPAVYQSLALQTFIQVTKDTVILRLFVGPGASVIYDSQTHGRGWYEYRSTAPPDLIAGGETTLEFVGFFTGAADPDGALPTMLSLPWQQASAPWALNTIGTPMHRPVNQQGDSLNLHTVRFRCLLTDFGRPDVNESDPTYSTWYTVIADGWAGGDTQAGTVDDLNGEHLLSGEDSQTFPNAPNVSFEWTTIASGEIVSGLSYQLINHTPFVPDQAAALDDVYRQTDQSRWLPKRQVLVVHVDDQQLYYRPKTRAVVSDDPDTLVFEIDPAPPTLSWPVSGAPLASITSQPAEITIRVGPARISSNCPECIENQQPTPMAWELNVGGQTINLLRRADCMWAAHVPGVKPHWLTDGGPLLPDPLPDRLWILDGLETLRLYEIPVTGPRRPIAVYRFRPIEHPQPLREADDTLTTADESFHGWQSSSLDCASDRQLTLWMFGQGYDPARHLLPSTVGLTPIGRECVYGSVPATWNHQLNRWEPLDAEILPDDFGLPAVAGTYPDRDERTLCVGYNSPDAGIVWIDDVERWRVFAISCAQDDLPAVPASPDDGDPGDVRRIRCDTPNPPPPSTCRWISNDGTTWTPIPPPPGETACPDGWECREPWQTPQFVGDVQNGICEPVNCLGGDSTWVYLAAVHDWFLQEHSCPDWCTPIKPGHVGFDLEVAKGTCWCPTCT